MEKTQKEIVAIQELNFEVIVNCKACRIGVWHINKQNKVLIFRTKNQLFGVKDSKTYYIKGKVSKQLDAKFMLITDAEFGAFWKNAEKMNINKGIEIVKELDLNKYNLSAKDSKTFLYVLEIYKTFQESFKSNKQGIEG